MCKFYLASGFRQKVQKLTLKPTTVLHLAFVPAMKVLHTAQYDYRLLRL
jgi:hypothetical protein